MKDNAMNDSNQPPHPEGICELNMRTYGDEAYTVLFRQLPPTSSPKARYQGFRPGTVLLKKGQIRRKGALPLPCDIVLERDVAITLRDGITIYTDVFRPAIEGQHPALVAWSPYGKDIGGIWLDDVPNRSGIPLSSVSEFQKFEGPDPAFWVNEGYVILHPDPRGIGDSEGNLNFWGRQLAEDGHDFIEWAAKQPWCTGNVGMTGNSWLAIAQWFIAAEQPIHLKAIAPWEGAADIFRDSANRGGIPMPAFAEAILQTFSGKGLAEDLPRMSLKEQTMTPYWEDKVACLDKICVPAYVVASYTNAAHTHGSFEGFRQISSEWKWLRVNNTHEWSDYYTPKYVHELLGFFDKFLKDKDNGWEKTPPVRICILDPGNQDVVDREETSWPPAEVQPLQLFLSKNYTLDNDRPDVTRAYKYDTSSQDGIELVYTFNEDVEVIGYISLRLWVEAVGSDDMELAITVKKHGARGEHYNQVSGEGLSGGFASTGYLRVSQREKDELKSTSFEPQLTHKNEALLQPGDIVSVDISLWPTAVRYHEGDQLRLKIVAHHPVPKLSLGFGEAPVEIAASGKAFFPNSETPLIILGGKEKDVPVFIDTQRVTMTENRNGGDHIIHYGGKYDSHLLIPLKKVL